ncbi:hypothetical protein [Jeotgalibacillus proteolyticus]|uniref:Abortive phage infection protein n=1 Tax=Jeotgalibacillus proteolyticus TaxID=2082395 RepID=A0A2S5GH64_9BACL|nr:hypothetical protein [Jeotgalibacillus proteolyticus]PPA72235.1 hypothetical protein C4B60_02330 [Jeotgalibacillus proteolyticus]
MESQEIESLLSKLRSGDITRLEVAKEDFLAFREQLVNAEDFKHFRGIAQRNGGVTYEYLEKPRS